MVCRACRSRDLEIVLTLGKSPLANSFLKKGDLNKKELCFPLTLLFCNQCNLVQLSHIVNPDLMFKNYLYVSSTSNVFIKHFEFFAKDVKKSLRLKKDDLVVDIGSNDGILLKPFQKLGLRVLGVDPAINVAKIANKNGIKTICDYFSPKTAKFIVENYGKPKVITAANVFAHTDNWKELVLAVKIALSDDGVFIIEAPYLVDFVEKNLFDTIYHEHLSYISIRPLMKFFDRNGMKIFDAQRVSSHGGSIRIFIKRSGAQFATNPRVNKLVKLELSKKLNTGATLKDFFRRIEKNKIELLNLLRNLKKGNKKIIGYGAPAKGNTLLNYFGINNRTIDFIVDDSPLKQSLYTPGTQIPIKSPEVLESCDLDYIVILAWNFADSIISKYKYLKKRGVAFIVPVPIPEIVSLKREYK